MLGRYLDSFDFAFKIARDTCGLLVDPSDTAIVPAYASLGVLALAESAGSLSATFTPFGTPEPLVARELLGQELPLLGEVGSE